MKFLSINKDLYLKPRRQFPFAKVMLITIIGISIVIVLFNSYYRLMQGPKWTIERNYMERAIYSFDFREARSASRFAWDVDGYVVRGIDKDGERALAFLSDQAMFEMKEREGLNSTMIKEQFKKMKPKAKLISLQLSIFEGQPAWQLYYSLKVNDESKLFYDFFDFRTGKLLFNFELSKL